jgi:O-antigen/teichoic acid export membrane protein
MGIVGVALSSVGSSVIVAAALTVYVVLKTGVRYDKALAYKMLAFSWPMWFAGLAGLYIGSANRYYMRIFSSIGDIGLYALAERFAAIMLTLIWQPFSQYWMVESFKYHQDGNKKAFNAVFRILCASLFITGLGISVFARPVIHVMATKAFQPAATAVPLLVLGAIFASLANFASFSFLVTEKTRLLSAYSYITAAVVSLLYIVLIPPLGYVGAAIAMAAAQGIQLLIIHVHGHRRFDMGISLTFVFFLWGATTVAYLVANFSMQNFGVILDIAARSVCWLSATLLIAYWILRDEDMRLHALEVMPAPLRPFFSRFIRNAKTRQDPDS